MSETINNGGPAFPIADPFSVKCPSTDEEALRLRNGMTLRDWFAGMALQGLLASEVRAKYRDFATGSYMLADEMLLERKSK